MADYTEHIQTGAISPERCFHLSYDKVEAYLRVNGVGSEAIQAFLGACMDVTNPAQAMDNLRELQRLPHIREVRESELTPTMVGVNNGTVFDRAENLTLQAGPGDQSLLSKIGSKVLEGTQNITKKVAML